MANKTCDCACATKLKTQANKIKVLENQATDFRNGLAQMLTLFDSFDILEKQMVTLKTDFDKFKSTTTTKYKNDSDLLASQVVGNQTRQKQLSAAAYGTESSIIQGITVNRGNLTLSKNVVRRVTKSSK